MALAQTGKVQVETSFQGTVEVFALLSHEKAKRAYAWQYADGDETKNLCRGRNSVSGFA